MAEEQAADALAWVWAPPQVGQVFAHTTEECRERLESRRRFFQRVLGLPTTTDCQTGDGQPTVQSHLGTRASFFHVAGTNGKGSVCAMLEACLSSIPNKSVGVFTSPQLHSFRERIRVNKQLMEQDRVVPLIEKAKVLAGDDGKSFNFFDKLLLLAFLYFEEKQVDYVVLETGLGGRWDPTNVIMGPALRVSLITSISMDHQEVLGDTIAEIAWQKAGIIKNGTPAVTMASQHPDALRVFKEEAALKQTSLTVIDTIDEEAVTLLGNRLEGDIQRENVTLAIAGLSVWIQALLTKDDELELSKLKSAGLPTVYHPGRFELFHLPLHNGDGEGRSHTATTHTLSIIIDGGHNEDGLRKLFSYARKRFPHKRIVTVFGCGLYEKKFVECLHIAYQQSDRIALVASSHFKSAPVTLLQQNIRPLDDVKQLQAVVDGIDAAAATPLGQPSVADGMRAAIAMARSCSKSDTDCEWIMLVCGSLFVAADGREFLASLIPFPPHDWVHHAEHKQYVYK